MSVFFGTGHHEPKGCRFILGDVKSGDWHYCQGSPQAGSPYCDHHHDQCRLAPGTEGFEQAIASMNASARYAGFVGSKRAA